MAEDRANSNARVFPTLPGVYSEGVKVIPGGSQPLTPNKPPFDLGKALGYPDQSKPSAKINNSTGGPDKAKFVMGSERYGPPNTVKPEGRPAPNQGTKVFTPGVGTKTFGGSQPGAIPITGPTPPKNPGRVATFFKGVKGGGLGPMLGGGGPFNKID